MESEDVPSMGCFASFSLSIDARKSPSDLEISTAYTTIMGGSYPNDFISAKDLSAEQINAIVRQFKDTPIVIKPADEIKVVIMSFQNCPPGVSLIEIVGAQPQTSNEVSTFTAAAVDAAIEACSDSGSTKVVFTNFAVDGVSAESFGVMTTVCEFLNGRKKHIAGTDNKHNCKIDRYQEIGSSCVASIGNYIVDSDLLHRAYV